ncbi:MAG: hypothetical protein ABI682_13285, partial [Acidobacteriota bacterium]
MRDLVSCLRLFFFVLSGLVLLAAVSLAEGTTYAVLRDARPAGAGLAVSNLVLERDAFRFRFESGCFQMVSTSEGHAIGAVFSGQGAFELTPASEAESRFFAIVSGEKSAGPFIDRFQTLVLLFGDATAAEIQAHSSSGAAPAAAVKIWEDFSRRQRKVMHTNLQIRFLQGLLAPEDPGVFLAAFSGKKLPFSVAVFDPAGLDWLSPNLQLGSEEAGLFTLDEPRSGFWYLSHPKGEAAHRPRPIARASHYQIDTTIQRNGELRGTATIRFTAAVPRLRVLPLTLT